jgi:hypothetical protein
LFVFLLLRHLFFVQVAEGLGGCIQRKQPSVFNRGDGNIIQGNDSRKLGNICSECTKIMVATIYLYGNRQLRIEVLDLLLAWFEQLELEATTKTRLVNFYEQGFNFGLIRELFE